jgi:hypothetical protein
MEKVIYLHGFASSPRSRKATLFQERFREKGVDLEVPDLSEGEFVRMTITSQLEVLRRSAGEAEVSLIGSSMGGYLAALAAARSERIKRVVLMAPAFSFAVRYAASLGAGTMQRWQEEGYLQVQHYGSGSPEPLAWSLMEDARFYEAEPAVTQPALIFHGTRDDVVPVDASRHFAAGRENVRLVEYDSDHELTDAAEDMFTRTWQFLTQPD